MPDADVPADFDQTNRHYRTFEVGAISPPWGGTSGYATNRDLEIWLTADFPNLTLPETRREMRRLVDETIRDRQLDIPPYVARVREPEEPNSVAFPRIYKQHLELQRIRKMSKTFHFDVTAGIQAGAAVFSAMLPLKLLVELIEIDWVETPVEERYQRIPSPKRVRELKNYVVETQDAYILPPLTASIEGEYEFQKYEESDNAGRLTLHPGVKLYLIDGGHRRKGAEQIIQEVALLGRETIGVYFVIDRGLEQLQQWFATVNRTMQRVPKTLELQYDQSDRDANFNREVVDSIPLFSKYTNRETGSASENKLFVLTWFYNAHRLMRSGLGSYSDDLAFCRAFWQAAIANIPDWRNYDPKKVDPKKARDKISATAIFLKAMASVGGELAIVYCREAKPSMQEDLNKYLEPLQPIEWTKDNPELQGVIVQNNKILTRNHLQLVEFIKSKLGKTSPAKSSRKRS
jgi:DNA sulfur modification protein DndB